MLNWKQNKERKNIDMTSKNHVYAGYGKSIFDLKKDSGKDTIDIGYGDRLKDANDNQTTDPRRKQR